MAAGKLPTSLAFLCVTLVGDVYVYAQTDPSGLTVEQAVTEALDHNLALAAERYNIKVADTAIVTAGLRPNPVLTVSAVRPEAVLKSAGVSTADDVVHGDYLFERGDKRQLRVAQSQAARTVLEAQLLDTARQLRLDVQSACVDVQLAQLNLDLARDNLQAFNSVVQVNVERVRAGDLSQVELMRSRLAAVQFETDVRQQQAALSEARARLGLLLGRDVEADGLQVIGELRRDELHLDRAALRFEALSARPDLQAARRDQARTAADARLQLANGKVDLTLSGEYHRQSGGGLTGSSTGVFLSVPLPIFNRNQGEIARASAQQQQADTRVRALSARVSTDVETAYGQFEATRDVLTTIESQMLQPARDVRSSTEYSYRRGEASFVEFLDAVRAFNDTMHSYNAARAEYARSLFTIDALTGRVTP